MLTQKEFVRCASSTTRFRSGYVETGLPSVQRMCALADHVIALPDPVDPDELAALNVAKADATLLKAHCEALP